MRTKSACIPIIAVAAICVMEPVRAQGLMYWTASQPPMTPGAAAAVLAARATRPTPALMAGSALAVTIRWRPGDGPFGPFPVVEYATSYSPWLTLGGAWPGLLSSALSPLPGVYGWSYPLPRRHSTGDARGADMTQKEGRR